jgi:hypothetical protein
VLSGGRHFCVSAQAKHMPARNTIDSCSRPIGDFLCFVGRLKGSPEPARREHAAEYLRDLLTRKNLDLVESSQRTAQDASHSLRAFGLRQALIPDSFKAYLFRSTKGEP